MLDTEKRLLSDLNTSAAFLSTVPAGREISWLEFVGSIAPGDLIYGAEPAEIAVVPRAIANSLAINCARHDTRIATGKVEGQFTNSASFATTHGWEVGGSVQFKAGWPAAETTWTISATYSGSTTAETGESETWIIEHGWEAPVLPLSEFDIQLQVIQQEIEGQPYELDLELRGQANIYHRPVVQWVSWTGRLPSGAVSGGGETVPTTDVWRNLPICRAWHAGTTHPGKVVSGYCNISYAGKEYEKTHFEVLVSDQAAVSWESHSGGSTNQRLGVVAGQERRADQHDGRLYVCRAEYADGKHPGKLVINDCMFGYGGAEILRGNYEILVIDQSAEDSYKVLLEDYLAFDQRTFRIAGEFRGTKALTSSTVFGDPRPVSDQRCALAPPARTADAAPDEAGAARSVALLPAEPDRIEPDRIEPDRIASPRAARAPEQALALLAPGTVHSRADLSGEEPPAKATVEIRTLRLEKPHMFGADVLAAQQALREAGWPIRADGFFGPRTDRALRHFQRANALREDGILGPRTRTQLDL